MKAKIALATVDGKAYYKLVSELQRRGLPFLSLKPWDSIPLDAKVVITTEEERGSVTRPNVLVLENGSDPALVVDEAIRVVQGKSNYDKVIIGVDPGKTYGIAVLGDDRVLETINSSSLAETVSMIVDSLKRAAATGEVVKVGNGAPVYTKELLNTLDALLPKNVVIEIVSEAGTSHLMNETAHRRGLRDMMSAIEIARRKGQPYSRKEMR